MKQSTTTHRRAPQCYQPNSIIGKATPSCSSWATQCKWRIKDIQTRGECYHSDNQWPEGSSTEWHWELQNACSRAASLRNRAIFIRCCPIKFYTGFPTYKHLLVFWEFVKPNAERLVYSYASGDRQIHTLSVNRKVTTWENPLYFILGSQCIWQSKKEVQDNMLEGSVFSIQLQEWF